MRCKRLPAIGSDEWGWEEIGGGAVAFDVSKVEYPRWELEIFEESLMWPGEISVTLKDGVYQLSGAYMPRPKGIQRAMHEAEKLAHMLQQQLVDAGYLELED